MQVTLFLWNRFLEPLVSPRVHFSLTRERDRLAAIQKELPDEGKDQTPNRHNFQYYVTKYGPYRLLSILVSLISFQDVESSKESLEEELALSRTLSRFAHGKVVRMLCWVVRAGMF